jgi:hypothetical protein
MSNSPESNAPLAPAKEPKRRRRRLLWILPQVLFGLGLGAVISEYFFSARAEGAFPHVNFYVADPELGVRLAPGAAMRFKLRDNPVTTIHVNDRGYRGGAWPAPGGDEIIVVGDSQVFGLGVEDDQTAAARLAELRGAPVLNAGVPTYGPREYMAVAAELLAERRPRAVIVVLNFVNDPFEIERPNRERHAVWDGWAVRSETAPAETFEFPGRAWLFSQSHAVYALRRWLHDRGQIEAPEGSEAGPPIDLGTPSEGGFGDLVHASREAKAAAKAAEDAAEAALAASKVRIATIDAELVAKRDALDELVTKASDYSFSEWKHEIARGRPGDIVSDDSAEESRSVALTAAFIREAARERDALIAQLLADEAKRAKRTTLDLLSEAEALTAERRRLRQEIARGAPPPPPPPPSIFHDYLAQFKALCDAHGAELIVVALPIDVQVDPREWAKYGVEDAPSMDESLVLLDDLVADAGALGLRALNPVGALRDASPGAFLDHDIHMTAKGQAALAQAIFSEALSAPLARPLAVPAGGLPEGQNFAPGADEWSYSDEIVVKGSSAAGCTTQARDGWLRVQCRRQRPKDRFIAVQALEGATPATMALRTDDALSLVTPLTPGAPITARFFWQTGARELQVRWTATGDGAYERSAAIIDLKKAAQAPAPGPDAEQRAAEVAGLCACHITRRKEHFCSETGAPDGYDRPEGCQEACAELWADPALIAPCKAAFGEGDCAALLACAQNDPLAAPTCPQGQIHAFATNHCYAACDDAHPCQAGACTPWLDGSVCLL